ncbi:MAG: YbjQ family protein [Gemmatimonadota bacterium]
MILTTTSEIPGLKVVRTYGMVRGSTIRARHLGKDILAVLRNLVGGEIHEYTSMLAEAREQAVDRMIEDAKMLGANAVICVRFQTSQVVSGAAELLCYGTAVTLEPHED